MSKEFMKYKNWVVIGSVNNEDKYAHRILKELKEKKFNVVGVNPKDEDGVYKNLKDVPFNIEVIDLCINPALGIKYIKEANELGIKNILIQPGAESEEILSYIKDNGMNGIEGCVLVSLRLHLN